MSALEHPEPVRHAGRAPYSPPQLQVFGSLASVTANVNLQQSADGGHGSKSRSAS